MFKERHVVHFWAYRTIDAFCAALSEEEENGAGAKVDAAEPASGRRGGDDDHPAPPRMRGDAWKSAGVDLDWVKTLIKEKEFQGAVTQLEKVLEKDPHDCEALVWMGAAQAYTQNSLVAARYYRRFVNSCPADKRFKAVRNILEAVEKAR